jgi:hypothetical protein
VKTPQGKYVIFDITEFLPGRKIPEDFCKEARCFLLPTFGLESGELLGR